MREGNQKEFTKADLKDGMVIEYRNGKIGFCINGKILYENGFDVICDLTEDLLDEDYDKKYDIIKVYKLNMSGVHELKSVLEKKNLILIWERIETKRMTTEEMRQKLEELTGEKIEIEPSIEEMVGVLTKHCSKYDNCNLCCIRKECEKMESLIFGIIVQNH